MSGFTRLAATATLAGLPALASGTIITLDADDYASGTDLSTVLASVTLSVEGAGGPVLAVDDGAAATGSRSFGNTASNGVIAERVWFEGNGFSPATPGPVLRLDFTHATGFVAIDITNQDSFDGGILRVFDLAGTELETASSAVTGQFGAFPGPRTLSVQRGAFDIAYATVAGFSAQDSVHLDHLRFAVRVAEPGAAGLIALGALAAAGLRRRGTERGAWQRRPAALTACAS